MSKLSIRLLLVAAFLIAPPWAAAKEELSPQTREAIDGALLRARGWLDRLEVDTRELSRHGVKEKKKLGEILAAYRFYDRAAVDEAERTRLRARVAELAAQTRRGAYHDLYTRPADQFRQNSMSYLRVLRLLREFDIDTRLYWREVLHAKPRFDKHFAERGPWQRAIFARYYELFGLHLPRTLRGARDVEGLVSSRMPFRDYTKRRAYEVAHEVFVAFDYGRASQPDGFDQDDIA